MQLQEGRQAILITDEQSDYLTAIGNDITEHIGNGLQYRTIVYCDENIIAEFLRYLHHELDHWYLYRYEIECHYREGKEGYRLTVTPK